MTRARRILGLVAAALLAASALATPAYAGKADNSIRFGSNDTLDNADPYFNTSSIGAIVADQVWDTLIYRDPFTGEYRGNLATAWRWIDDRTLELDLRQGVKFHNGATFDAHDVVYTLNFVSKPENGAVYFSIVRWIERVEKLGEYKVRIVAKAPFPAAVAYLAMAMSVIHPHEYYAQVGPKGVSAKPIGTGPYRVVEHAIGKHVRLERNPEYFKESPKTKPKVDKVEIRFIPDAQTRVAETIVGGLDLIMYVAPDQADQLRGVRSLEIVSAPSSRYGLLQMNTLASTPAPQLRDIRVRQAIMHAIDRETMAKFLAGEGARVLHSECRPSQFGCTDEGVPRYDYDPAKAKRLLTEAGYAAGFDIDLYTYMDRTQAEAIVGYLNAVGIRARLRVMQFAAVRNAVRASRVALVFGLWGTVISDVSNSVSVFHEFGVDDMNRDPEIRDLLLRGDSAMDPDVRKRAYAEGLKLIAQRAYTLPLFSLPAYYLAAKDLVSRPNPDSRPRFYEMYYR
jgi:peptide/nickel transport system substrate-binding protein